MKRLSFSRLKFKSAWYRNCQNAAAKIHGGAVDPHIDNMLKVSMDGKKLGLDQRLINPMLRMTPEAKSMPASAT